MEVFTAAQTGGTVLSRSPGATPSRASLWLYGAPAVALAIPTIPVYVELPSFYATTMGVGMTAIGAALMIARLSDVVVDPLIGLLCDTRATRFGKRKPWIALGALVAGIALFRLFDPPAGAGAGHLMIWATLLYVGWTLIAIPYAAWGAELSPGYHERARITGVREGASLLGILAAGILLALGPRLGWAAAETQVAIAVAAIVIGAPTLALLLWLVPEHSQASSAAGPPPRARALLRNLHRNKPFVRLVVAWLANGLANGLAAALLPLYLQHRLIADEATRGLLIFCYFAAGIMAIPGWLWLSRHIGKHRTWCAAMLGTMVVFLFIPFIEPGEWHLFLAVCLLTGTALGADLSLPPALQADVVDYDAWKFGRKRAAVLFALWNMATKLALALSVGIAFPLLDAFGFDANAGANAPGAITALVVIYALIPVVIKAVSVALVWNYPLTYGRHRAIRLRLERVV
jgi:Na+/melibiose symporter-like transporter